MGPARRIVLALSVATAATLLASCEKPTPSVSMVSGRNVVRSDAQVWCAKDEKFSGKNCQANKSTPPRLQVLPGNAIGIDVDPEVAANGWVVAIGGQRVSGVLKQQYYKLPINTTELRSGSAEVQVIAVGRGEDSNRGLWLFTLKLG